MGGGDNEITVKSGLDASGFEAGTKRLEDAINSLGKTVEDIFTRMQAFVENIDFSALGEALESGDWEAVGENIRNAMAAAAEAVEDVDTDTPEFDPDISGWERFKAVVGDVVGGVKRGMSEIGSAVSKVGGVVGKIGGVFKKALGGIGTIAKKAASGFTAMFKGAQKGSDMATAGMKRFIGMALGVSSVYGIISKAVNTYMSQNQKLSAQMGSIWTALGNVIGPVIEKVISLITSLISYFLEFLRLIGVTSKTASQLSKKANAAGAAMKKTVAGFDELNMLQDNSGGGGPDGRLEDKEAPEWIKDIAEFLKQGEWEKAGSVLAQKLNEMVASVDWRGIGEKIGYYLNGALTFIATVIREFDWKKLGQDLADLVSGVLNSVDWSNLGTIFAAKFTILIDIISGFLENLDWAALATAFTDFALGFMTSITESLQNVDWNKIGENINTFFENVDWSQLGGAAGELVKALVNGITTLIAKVNWQNIGNDVATFLGAVDWNGVFDAICQGIGAVLGGLGGFLWGLISDAWESVVEWWHETAYEDGEFTMQGLLDGIWQKIKDIGTWIYNHIFKPFIDGFKKAFEISSPSKKMKTQGEYIIEGLLDGLKEKFAGVLTWLGSLWGEFKSAIGRIGESALTWGKDIIVGLWNGIQSQLSAFWEGIKGIAQGIRNFIGFSEPKEGPLSDFHTYGPDMMKLYAKGIEDNKGMVLGAVSDLAGSVSDALESGDYSMAIAGGSNVEAAMDNFADRIVDGFGDMIDRLSAIMDTVTFGMPEIAGGGIVPYGVGAGPAVGDAPGSADLTAAVNRLTDLVGDFQRAVNNMQWVAQFGEMRAVVKQITAVQKQMERANG